MEARTREESGGSLPAQRFGLIACLVSFFVASPLLVTRYLTMFDYPNHVARYALLSRFQDTKFFQDYFVVNSRFIPNLGFDFLAVNLAKVLSPPLAAQVVIFAAVFLSGLGLCCLAKKLQGQATWLTFFPPVFLWTFSLNFGFNNFVLAFAFLPWAVLAFESFLDSQGLRYVVVYIGLCVAAFLCHAQVSAFAILIASVFAATKESSPLSLFKRSVAAFAPAVALVPILALSPSSGEFSRIQIGSIKHKLYNFVLAFLSGSPLTDLAFLLILVGLTLYIFATKQAGLGKRGWLVCGALLVLSIIVPAQLKIASNLDTRVVGIAAAFGFAFLSPGVGKLANGAKLLLALLVFRSAMMGRQLLQNGHVAQSVVAEMSKLPDTAIVFNVVADSGPIFNPNTWNPAVLNLPYFGLWDRPIYASGLYSYESQQPMVYSQFGRKLEYLGIFEDSNHGGPSDQLATHLAAIRARMKMVPASFWNSHQPYVFIGFPKPVDIVLPPDLEAIAQQPKFVIAKLK